MEKLEDIKSKAKERGYKFLIGNKTSSELHYTKNDIALIINPKIEGFSLNFYIDELISLETIQCGSFMNDEYFNNIESDFVKYINKLKMNYKGVDTYEIK